MGPKYVDIHAHMSDKAFQGMKDTLMRQLGDYIVLNAGENPGENAKVFLDSGRYKNLFPCIGLHPNYISAASKEEVFVGLEYVRNGAGRAFAISEIGLDFKEKTAEQMALQKSILNKLLEIAERNNKPCIMHSRKSMDAVLDALSSFKVKAVLHNFEGNNAQYARAIGMGVYVSISTGFIRFKRDSLIKKLDLGKAFVETDSPVLSPDSNINTPLNIPKILNYMAVLRNMQREEVARMIFENFKRLFYG